MITTADCIRRVRPIAHNIDDTGRIEPYIREAELLNILPQIGAELYQWLDESDFSDNGPWVFRPTGVKITKEQHEQVLMGGYYHTDCGSGHSVGLIAAVAYYAYSRAVLNHQINVTSMGVVKKRSEFSEPIDTTTLLQASREARKLGDEVAREVVEHLKALGLIVCAHRPKRVQRFMVVGSKKM